MFVVQVISLDKLQVTVKLKLRFRIYVKDSRNKFSCLCKHLKTNTLIRDANGQQICLNHVAITYFCHFCLCERLGQPSEMRSR